MALAVCAWLNPPVVSLVNSIGTGIQIATQLQPFMMGIVISVVVGLLLTMPTSSAAICIAIGLNGLAGGAAVVGCAAHMIGFAVASFKDNGMMRLLLKAWAPACFKFPISLKSLSFYCR